MKKLLICNWKMNLSYNEAISSAKTIAEISTTLKNSEIWISPTPIYASEIAKAVAGSSVRVGAQNCHWEERGAFTGETSPIIAKSCGITFTILGHSERRGYFNESNEEVAKRFLGCQKNGFLPVVCIGETLEQREQGKTETVILEQLSCLNIKSALQDFFIAYEPVWSLSTSGTGLTATPENINSAHLIIRNYLNLQDKNNIKILYGGNINPDNIHSMMNVANVSGGIIGGASLDIEKIKKMVELIGS